LPWVAFLTIRAASWFTSPVGGDSFGVFFLGFADSCVSVPMPDKLHRMYTVKRFEVTCYEEAWARQEGYVNGTREYGTRTGFQLSGLPADVESGAQELHRNSQHHRAAICRVGKTNPNPSLFLMFTSGKKGDLVIGGQDMPEMSDLYRVTLDRKGYKRDEMWGDLDALWRLRITTITGVGSSEAA
jgi:hypothetical protein